MTYKTRDFIQTKFELIILQAISFKIILMIFHIHCTSIIVAKKLAVYCKIVEYMYSYLNTQFRAFTS